MRNRNSPWNNKQNDTESISTMIISKLPKPNPKAKLQFYIPPTLYSSGPIFTRCESARVCRVLRAPTDLQFWGSAPLLVASLALTLRAGGTRCPAAGRVLVQLAELGTGCPQRAGEPPLHIAAQQPRFGLPPGGKLPSGRICFFRGSLATPSWDCGAESSQNIPILFSVTLKVSADELNQ